MHTLYGIYDIKTSLVLTIEGWKILLNSGDLSVIYFQSRRRAKLRLDEESAKNCNTQFELLTHHCSDISKKYIAD